MSGVLASAQALNTPALPLLASYSSSLPSSGDARPYASSRMIGPATTAAPPHKVIIRPISKVAIALRVGLGGIGADMATPLSRHFNLRAGAETFSYAYNFTDTGANVATTIRLRSGHTSLDWFPFGGSFRISPLVNYGNNNAFRGTVLVPAGSSITLSGSDYVSSTADPLRGSASVGFRKTSPGLSFGFGNMIPRTGKHFSFPVEIGFYYVGQPTLKVAFTGSACDPSQPQPLGCQSVNNDAGFQSSLTAFTARNNHNLSYASFFPVLSSGVGFRF